MVVVYCNFCIHYLKIIELFKKGYIFKKKEEGYKKYSQTVFMMKYLENLYGKKDIKRNDLVDNIIFSITPIVYGVATGDKKVISFINQEREKINKTLRKIIKVKNENLELEEIILK